MESRKFQFQARKAVEICVFFAGKYSGEHDALHDGEGFLSSNI